MRHNVRARFFETQCSVGIITLLVEMYTCMYIKTFRDCRVSCAANAVEDKNG